MSVETLCLIVGVLSLFVSIRFGLYVMRREERQGRERIATAAKQPPPQPEAWMGRYRDSSGLPAPGLRTQPEAWMGRYRDSSDLPAPGLRIQEDNEPQGPFFNNHFGGHFP